MSIYQSNTHPFATRHRLLLSKNKALTFSQHMFCDVPSFGSYIRCVCVWLRRCVALCSATRSFASLNGKNRHSQKANNGRGANQQEFRYATAKQIQLEHCHNELAYHTSRPNIHSEAHTHIHAHTNTCFASIIHGHPFQRKSLFLTEEHFYLASFEELKRNQKQTEIFPVMCMCVCVCLLRNLFWHQSLWVQPPVVPTTQ